MAQQEEEFLRLQVMIESVRLAHPVRPSLGRLKLKSSESTCYRRRTKAIEWVNSIFEQSHSGLDARDTCIQTFDKFLCFCASEESQLVLNAKFVSIAAAVSAIVATKLHDSSRSLTPASFPYFKTVDLVNFERYLLDRIQYCVELDVTPILFVRYMLCVWKSGEAYHGDLFDEASALISAFWVSIESTFYAPFTIAISALLLAFSKLQLDSAEWLQYLPESCFPSDPKSSSSSCFDIDSCFQSFMKLESSQCSVESRTVSPNAITDVPEYYITHDLPPSTGSGYSPIIGR